MNPGGSFASGASLMALPDMVRFTLAYLLVVMAPGYALAALARPRAPHSARLALAIPCGYALVARPGALEESLLGMSFLERLRGYTVERGRLVLTAK